MAKDLESSFATLKQTIPLMLKHQVPAIPTNYALWYTYVSNESPELNASIDAAIENQQSISGVKAKEWYRNYLADTQEVDAWQLRQSLEAMLVELSQTMTDTRSDTDKFKSSMDGCLEDLTKVEKEGWTIEEVMGLVRNMVKETQQIRQSTLGFNASLANAEKEIASLRQQLQESEKEAYFDALTGLRNRRYFDAELDANLKAETFSLVLVDIDHFKKINDCYGHLMGDLVLKAVAKKLQASCREGADAFRYGGEEFAILLPNTNLKQARHRADVMRRAIEKINVVNKRTNETLGDITASFGVAQLQASQNAEQLVEQADKLLYEAKRLGRNRVMPVC